MGGKVARYSRVRPVSGGSIRGGRCSVREDAAVLGGAIPLERSSPTVRVERETSRDPWGRVPHPGPQPMGYGFQESSRGIAQGGSHSVPSLIRGAALGLFGGGPKIVLYPLGDSLTLTPNVVAASASPSRV